LIGLYSENVVWLRFLSCGFSVWVNFLSFGKLLCKFSVICRLVVRKERETIKTLKKKRNSSYVCYGFRLKG